MLTINIKMTQIKRLFVGVACLLIGAILATTTTPSERQSVLFSGPLAAPLQGLEVTSKQQQDDKYWPQLMPIRDRLARDGGHERDQIDNGALMAGLDEDSAGPPALVDIGQLKRVLRSLGMRRIQQQPASLGHSNRLSYTGPIGGGVLERAVSRAYQGQIEGETDELDAPRDAIAPQFNKRSPPASDEHATSLQQDNGGVPASKHEFIYVIAPISEQVLPFQNEKFAQGYKNFVSLAGPDYKIGLQKLSTPADLLTELNGGNNQQEEAKVTHEQALFSALALEQPSEGGGGIGGASMESSESNMRLASLRQRLGGAALQLASSPRQPGDSSMLDCRPVQASVRISRDDFDMQTGQLVRQCTGLATLNSCEGNCVSSVQPTIKSSSGLLKVSVTGPCVCLCPCKEAHAPWRAAQP